jgi:DNA (cytosine-5)-methyltransferase 1
MNYLSVCSGIEAATVAWHPLGWNPVGFSEIELFPSQVLKHHYPTVPNLGDMTKFKEWKIESNIDVFVGGTPCQSFSVAGLRKGLDDPRGNLMLTYLAIAKQHRPRWLVWENVPGVLSSADGRDFGSFLGGLAVCGYGFAYRVLDAQYFGVAQRRKRVFVVGYLGDWRPAAAVLFERHSLQGHPAPSREKGQAIAPNTRTSASSRSAITARMVAFGEYSDDGTASAMKARDYKDATDLVAQPIVVDRAAFNQGENAKYKFRAEPSETMDSLVAKGPHAVLQPIPIHDQATRHAGKNGEKTMGKGNGLGIGQEGDPMNTLTKGDRHAVAQPMTFSSVLSNQSLSSKLEVSQTLEAKNSMAVAYNIAPGKGELKDDIHVTDAYIAKTIDASGSNPAMHQDGAAIVQSTGVDIFNAALTGEIFAPLTRRSDGTGTGPTVMVAPTLTASNNPSRSPQSTEVTNQVAAIHAVSMAVRRLTPTECERLQGFPDNYTNIKSKGKATPDGPRYKALGNSMAVPVMAWIGQRIQKVEDLIK